MQGGREYGGKFRGINKSLKPVFGRQRRPDQHSKRVLPPVRKSSAQKIMQSQIQVHETMPEAVEEPACQREGSAEQIVKNGPESCSSFEEDQKEEIVVKVCSVMMFLNLFLPDILSQVTDLYILCNPHKHCVLVSHDYIFNRSF